MFNDLRIFCLGVGAVVATALLLTLLDRRNWKYLQAPIFILGCAGFAFHTGVFVHALLEGANGQWSHPTQWLTAVVATCGLALMPSGLLHAVLRMRHEADSPPPGWYWCLYLPALMTVPALSWIWRRPESSLLDIHKPLVNPYVLWTIAALLIASWELLKLRGTSESPLTLKAAPRLAISLFAVAGALGLAFGVVGRDQLTTHDTLRLVLCGLPLLPALVFGYLVIRYNLMRLTFEQTIAYGAIIVAALLLHQLTLVQLNVSLRSRLGFDIAILEGAAAVLLALAYRPLRQRISEALRYLMGSQVAGLRENSQRLAVELSARTENDQHELLGWFVPRLRETLEVPFVVGCFVAEGQPVAAGQQMVPRKTLMDWHDCLSRHRQELCCRGSAPEAVVVDTMSDYGIDSLLCGGRESAAIFAVGSRQFGPSLTEEERNAAKLLIEQFAVTLRNRELQRRTLLIEREAAQNEKLRTLGMLSSCMAHEVKNPLSTIKTIATVMHEDLGSESPHAEGLQLVIGEVDRLTSRTNELLGFARPAESNGKLVQLAAVMETTTRFLSHSARKRNIRVDVQAEGDCPALPLEENALREILFNLIGNSIEAARGQVTVESVATSDKVMVRVTDDGPGIAPTIAAQLFEPFATNKAHGTGLGLYIVKRRVEELGGTITFQTSATRGTTFTLGFPR